MTDHIDLNAIEDLEPEPMSEGDALGCCFSASSYSTSSCPGGTVASLGSASTLGGHPLRAAGGRRPRRPPATRTEPPWSPA